MNDECGTAAFILHRSAFIVKKTMGQKVNPIGFRVGIMEGWKSRWYASKQEFRELLMEDRKLRKYIKDKFKFAGVPKIEIERTRDEVKIIMHAARPGIIIGRKGQEVERLQEELQGLIGRRINIKIEEITRPEIFAQLVAEDIAEQLSKRASFRRTMKRAAET
jgi:small subunit ribosomal protein S3